jgi:hypothetical protein
MQSITECQQFITRFMTKLVCNIVAEVSSRATPTNARSVRPHSLATILDG